MCLYICDYFKRITDEDLLIIDCQLFKLAIIHISIQFNKVNSYIMLHILLLHKMSVHNETEKTDLDKIHVLKNYTDNQTPV